jgi:arsenate reductase (glutaredoxin)
MKARIYHNPRCSKSRATLELLKSRGLDLEIVEYLKTPPTRETLKALLAKLGLEARALIRAGEPEFREAGVPLDAPESLLIELMVTHPKLIERPIVEIGERARIGRPPENVLELIE